MIDMEKVIKGLEAMREFFGFGLPSQTPVFEAYQNVFTDAIKLLKEQEPLEPITDESLHVHVFRCRKCNRILQRNNEMDYCPKCGQPIKWQ